MVGRETELDDLCAWLCKEPAISVRVLTGMAGYGKTRLALELIEEKTLRGWRAGFLTRAELTRFRKQHNVGDWGWNAPMLAVVDYASASARNLNAWLKELEDNAVWENVAASNRYPLRLLLLERQAERCSGWWAEVFGRGDEATVLEKLADPVEPMALRPLDDANQRRAILTKTLACLGSTITLPAPGDDKDFDRRLTELTWAGVPLLLMIAATTAVREGFGHVLAMGSKELAFNVARTELARIIKVVESRGVSASLAPLVKHVTAVVTLCQGLAAEATREMIARESAKLGYNLPNGSAALRDAFAVALPNDADGIASVEPDMIGEALLLDVWRRDNTHALPAIARAHAADPDTVAKTVIRTCQDYVIRGHDHPLDWLEKIRTDSADLYALMHLSNAMPRYTLELREIAAELDTALVDKLRSRMGGSQDLNHLAMLGAALNNLSNRFSDLGRREDALATIEEAVAIRRDLAAARPDAFRPDLAMSLDNLSNHFSGLGRWEEALAASEKAVALCRDLAAARPDAFRPDLATALNNLSNHFSGLGRREEALAASEKAVALCRDLVATRPDAFRPDLATALNNLSNRFSDLGRWEEALAASEEAVTIRRNLAATRPDAFRPNLAMALNNLSKRFSDLDRWEEALAATEEAVTLYRDLAAARPDAFRPNLATALNNLSNPLSKLGQREDALAAIEEAVTLHRDLAAAYPDAFRPDLAMSLDNLSACFYELDRWEDALAAGEEAVTLYRDLAAAYPNAFRPDLAMSLDNLSACFYELDRREDALAAGEEAATLRRLQKPTVE